MPNTALPPSHIAIPSAWIGAAMAVEPDQWIVHLSASDIGELEHAAETFLGHTTEIGEISREQFPLPRFGAHLAALRQTLINGRGFEVLRGLPVAKYSQQMAAAIFCGIGAHLGSARSQNAMGHILGHVRDIGADANNPNTRIYQTAQRQTFHTDSADVVGLLCIREAMEGGSERQLRPSAFKIQDCSNFTKLYVADIRRLRLHSILTHVGECSPHHY